MDSNQDMKIVVVPYSFVRRVESENEGWKTTEYITVTVYVVIERDFHFRSIDRFIKLKEEGVKSLVAASRSAARYLLTATKIAKELKMNLLIVTDDRKHLIHRIYEANPKTKVHMFPCQTKSSSLCSIAEDYVEKMDRAYYVPWDFGYGDLENAILENLKYHWEKREERRLISTCPKKVILDQRRITNAVDYSANIFDMLDEEGKMMMKSEEIPKIAKKSKELEYCMKIARKEKEIAGKKTHFHLTDTNRVKRVWVADHGGLISRILSKFFENAEMNIVSTGMTIWPDLISEIPKKKLHRSHLHLYEKAPRMPLFGGEQDLYSGAKVWNFVHAKAENGDVVWLPN